MPEQKFMIGKPKIWKASKDALAGFMVTPNLAVMAGSKSNFIAVDGNGISIAGKGVSFLTLSENQRHGGFFVKMNDFVQMMPETIVTPFTHAQIPFPPLGMVTQMTNDLPFFLAMMVPV